jgi:amino acid adenylation domain-containing protein
MSEKQLLQKALLALQEKNNRIEAFKKATTEPVAVIGMACRFPGGVDSPDKYWELLKNGDDPVKKVANDPVTLSRQDCTSDYESKSPLAYLSLLEQVDGFDARFFRVSAKEAKCMDPQHRILLEVCWEALEDAGSLYQQKELETGVFVGVSASDYAQLLTHSLDISDINSFFSTGNLANAAAGRIAYHFGFKGPCIALDTACSSSLVSVHMACQSLRNNECKQAVAGGVNLILTPFGTQAAQQSEMLSPNGKSKSFDDAADGYVRGEGCGLVVLKRYSDAVRDGDNIHALIMSSGVAQAGDRGGLTVPNGRTQKELINSVIKKSGLSPEDIDYVEAHGSATPLGDTIELGALADIFKDSHNQKDNPLFIGAVKSNIGNLEVAAGIAGLMKAILSLKNKEIPANLHFEKPNSQLDWERTPLQIVQKNKSWGKAGQLRYAGVNALGFSGTNAHLILGEVIKEKTLDTDTSDDLSSADNKEVYQRPTELLCLSAKSEKALRQLVSKYLTHLEAHPDVKFMDLCYTANACRKHFDHRLAILANDSLNLKEKLKEYQSDSKEMPQVSEKERFITGFFFVSYTDHPSSASYGNLLDKIPVFKDKLIECSKLLIPYLENSEVNEHKEGQVFEDSLNFPRTTAFIQQYALAEMWQHWGITASVVMGHGIGEYLAGSLAGIMTLQDALQVIVSWDQYAQGKQGMTLDRVQQIIDSTAFNEPRVHFISGTTGKMVGSEVTYPSYWKELLEESEVSVLNLKSLKELELEVVFEIGSAFESTTSGAGNAELLYLPSQMAGKDVWFVIVQNLARFYEYGGNLDWGSFYEGYPVTKVGLPTYPFQRKSYWFTQNLTGQVYGKEHFNGSAKTEFKWNNDGSILEQLKLTIAELLEEPANEINVRTPLIELGADSIMITQAIKKIKSRFEVEIPLKALYGGLDDIESLARYIAEHAPLSVHNRLPAEEMMSGILTNKEYETNTLPSQDGGDLNSYVAQQLEMNAKLIEMLHKRNTQDNITTQLSVNAKPGKENDTQELSLMIRKLADQAWQLREFLSSDPEKEDYLRVFEEKAKYNLKAWGVAEFQESYLLNTTENQEGIINQTDNDKNVVPLTIAQQQLLRLAKIDKGGWIAYNFSSNMVLDGDLRIPLIKEVIKKLIERHESLRTVLDTEEEYMEIKSFVPATYEWKDYSQYSYEEAKHQLALWNLQESKTAFSLKEPFYRFSLLKLGEKKHVLSLSVHHILFDGWSVVILLKEFAALYASLHKGSSPQMETPMQFRELIQLRTKQDVSRIKKAEEYWMSKFSDTIPVLDLPLDYPRPLLNTYSGTKYQDDISKDLIENIKVLGKKHHTTLFTTLLAAYTLLLHKLSRQNQFVIGIPYAGRFLDRSETVVGYCSQLLPISSSFESEKTFTEHLKSTQNLLLEGFEHEDFPFSQLIDRLKEKQNIINNPLARATFNMNQVRFFPDVENLEADFAPTPLSYVAYDLTLTIIELENGYKVEWNYNTDLFKEASILHFSTFFKYLLKQILQDPSQNIDKFSLLDPEMELQIQKRWDKNKITLPGAKALHQLFEIQAEKTPDHEAIIQDSTSLSYHSLNERANKWCHYLKKQGIDEQKKVGVLLDKSVETIAVLLGIMKTGAVFVAIDTAMPEVKMDYVLKDVQPELLISKTALLKGKEAQKQKIIDIDKVLNAVLDMSAENPTFTIAPDEVAYIVYTSGSTGKPKGIMSKHPGVINYLNYLHKVLNLNNEDVVLQLAPLGFDASIRDIFGPLTTGAKVVLASDSRDFVQLAADLENYGITCLLSTVPSLLSGLTTEIKNNNPIKSALRMVLVSGEVLTTEVAKKVLETFGQASLYNQYGPTECTMTSTYYQVQPNNKSSLYNTQPIGTPIPNAEVYIMNNEQLVPDGIIGEICIGGIGLAKGYLNKKALTDDKFKSCYIIDNERKYLYKTGDLGRFNTEGVLEFFGRKDNQLKIRGFRVESSEIEAAVLKYPGIKSCAVIPEEENGEMALYCYLTSEEEEVTVNSLLSFLRKYLPEYALPSKFVLLESLPLTVNGKIDRKALQNKGSEVKSGSEYATPINEIEESLLQIWAQVLQKETISTQDEFFNIGGNSLKAIQLIGRINKKHKKLLTVADIFTNQTIQKLALLLENVDQQEDIPIVSLPFKDNYELSYAQRSLWIMDQLEENQIAYNISGKVLYEEKIDFPAFQLAFETLVKRHESLRTIFITEGDVPRQRILPWEETGFKVQHIDLSELEEAPKQLKLQEAEKEEAFLLEKGPLLRVKLIKLAEEKYLILCSTHHIIADGWSMNVLLNEVLTMYQAFTQQQPNPFPPLQIQFKDYAEWHNKRLQGKGLAKLSTFWERYLEGPLPVLELPFDKKRPDNPAFNGSIIEFVLEKQLINKIDSLTKQHKTTLFTALLTMTELLLYRYSGQDDIIVGIPIACRDRKELENQIGFYINTTAFRTKFTSNDTVETLLKRTGKNMMEVQEHSLYPFSLLMEDIERKGSLSGNNLFNVMIQIQDTHQGLVQSTDVGQIRETIMRTNNNISKFDLTFNFTLLDNGNYIPVAIEYNTDLFFKETIEKMRDDLLFLLDKVTTDTSLSINEQNILPLYEKADLLDDFLKPLDDF